MDITIHKRGPLKGEIRVPGDKSISHRALMLASLADGRSRIRGLSKAGDPTSTRACMAQLGILIEDMDNECIVHGRGLHGLRQSASDLDAGNSGTTMRLLSGILVGQRFASSITGDNSLRKRPMTRIMDPLTAMGGNIKSQTSGRAPLEIQPVESLHAITYALPVASAQVKSAVLLAGLYAHGTTVIEESIQTRDHTERMLGIRPEKTPTGHRLLVSGGKSVEPRDFIVPGDPSSAAFLIAAALLLPGSELLIRDVGLNPTRIGFLGHMLELGAHIEIQSLHMSSGEPFGNILIRASSLQGELRIEGDAAADVIDEIPILASTALAAGCSGRIRNAKELRAKESDRISALVSNMRSLGAEVEEYDDGFAFEAKADLHGSRILSEGDHRIAMSFGVLGCVVPGITIEGAEHAAISYPQFWLAIGAIDKN